MAGLLIRFLKKNKLKKNEKKNYSYRNCSHGGGVFFLEERFILRIQNETSEEQKVIVEIDGKIMLDSLIGPNSWPLEFPLYLSKRSHKIMIEVNNKKEIDKSFFLLKKQWGHLVIYNGEDPNKTLFSYSTCYIKPGYSYSPSTHGPPHRVSKLF